MCSVLPECLFLGLSTTHEIVNEVGKKLSLLEIHVISNSSSRLEHMKFPPTFLGCYNWSATIPDQLELSCVGSHVVEV